MMDKELLMKNMLAKCAIYYGDSLISSESIIKSYLEFFSKQISDEGKKTSFVFHTGSSCFDIVSVAALMLSCFTMDASSNDDTLQSLENGDMVLYKGERYRWQGFEEISFNKGESPIEYVVLQQDGKGKNGITTTRVPYERNKHLIKPYYGTSLTTDGRGIRKKKNNRTEFLSYLLGKEETEIPVSLDISVVVITEKNYFIDICQNLSIKYDHSKSVTLTDIVPVSYFTSNGEEQQIGNNPTKEEAVIKVVSKISAARSLVLNRDANPVVGLLATNVGRGAVDSSEFQDLIRRKTLKFVINSSIYTSSISDLVVEQYEDANVYACTKKFLSNFPRTVCYPCKLTTILCEQVRNIVNKNIETIIVNGLCDWDDYKQFKDLLSAINISNWEEDEKKDFIINAWGTFNLFTTAFFSLDKMEQAIDLKLVNSSIALPEARIERLEEVCSKTSFMKSECEEIVNILKRMYSSLELRSAKEEKLIKLLMANHNKKIAIVVPKSYYADIFRNFYKSRYSSDIQVTTANKFNVNAQYDLIISVGNISGKFFEPLTSFSSAHIYLLLYPFENVLHKYKERKYNKNEQKLNLRLQGIKNPGAIGLLQLQDNEFNEIEVRNMDRYIEKDNDFDDIINKLNAFDINKFIDSSKFVNAGTYLSDVKLIGTFTSGEHILFTKNYTAVVYDNLSNKLIEESPKDLSSGDVLVFMKNNGFTQNIVDFIFNKLSEENKLPSVVQEVYPKSIYWKTVLNDYRLHRGLTYLQLAKQFERMGVKIQGSSIRQWIDEECHVVGPRDENVFNVIAEITGDIHMLENPASYNDACRIVRKYRREILGLIGQAINDKFGGRQQNSSEIYKVIYENVENLSETLEIEEIQELDEYISISSSLTNRPIVGMEVAL